MKNKNTAFTLIELLVVIVIIGVLGTISISSYNGYQERAQFAAAQAQATQFIHLAKAENAAHGGGVISAIYDFNANSINAVSPFIIDSSQAGNDITYAAGPGTFSQASNGSLQIDSKMLYVYPFGDSPPDFFNPSGTPVNKATMAFSFKLENLGSYAKPAGIGNSFFDFSISSGKMKLVVNHNNVGEVEVKKRRWYYVMGSYNDDTKIAKFWLDGKLIANKTVPNFFEPFDLRGQYIHFGDGNYNNSPNTFNGYLNDVIISAKAYNGEIFE